MSRNLTLLLALVFVASVLLVLSSPIVSGVHPQADITAPVQNSSEALEKKLQKAFQEGRRLYFQGEFHGASLKFREATSLREQISGHTGALSLKYEGLCYQYEGNIDDALVLYRKALDEDEREHGVPGNAMADGLDDIGWALYLKGDYDGAIEYLKLALSAVRDADEPAGTIWYRGRIMADLGAVYIDIGDYSNAYRNLRYVLDNDKHYDDKMNETRSLQRMGDLKRVWGASSEALRYYERAVDAGRGAFDQPYNEAYLVDALDDLGALYAEKDSPQKAGSAFGEALAISRELSAEPLIARTLDNIGNLSRIKKDFAAALKTHREALQLAMKTGVVPIAARSLVEIGFDYLLGENYDQAADYFERAMQFGGQALTPELKARASSGMAETLEKLKRFRQASDSYDTAIRSIRDVNLGLLDEESKASYWQTQRETFEHAISLCARLSKPTNGSVYRERAFSYSESARARAFLDILTEAKIRPLIHTDKDLAREENLILSKIARINRAFLLGKGHDESSKSLETEFNEAQDQLDDLRQRVRLADPIYAELHYPEPASLEKIRSTCLDDKTLLIEYFVGTDRSYVWTVSRTQCQMARLPGRNALSRLVSRFRRVIGSPPKNPDSFRRYCEYGYKLYDAVLQPVEKVLKSYRRLIIIPDDSLYYLPFEAIVTQRSGNVTRPKVLLMDHAISYAPSASVLTVLKRYAPARSTANRLDLLAYGDPVFPGYRSRTSKASGVSTLVSNSQYNDVTSPGRGPRLEPLPYTRREIKEIAALYPRSLTKIALGPDATEAAFQREALSRYRCIHLATHAIIDERTAARSGVVFSLVGEGTEDGILQMNEIFNLRLNADLVVLSACETGLGHLAGGEGVIGLSRAFLYAGASSVLVSLWKVEDESTAGFITSFYKGLKSSGKKGEALRRAKLKILSSDIPAYRHPYYWAAFVLVGES